MRNIYSLTLMVAVGALYVQDGYAHRHDTYIVEQAPVVVVQPQAPAYSIVDTEPPAEIEEEMGVSPGVNYVWIKGHWGWDGARWTRFHGHWASRPHESAVWAPGYWEKHDHHHWRWKEGYWR